MCCVPQQLEVQVDTADWETCVVRLGVVKARLLRRWDWQLIAAILPEKGQIIVDVSPVFKARTRVTRWGLIRAAGEGLPRPEEFAEALEVLTRRLVQAGWEQQPEAPRESAWFLRGFRRPTAGTARE